MENGWSSSFPESFYVNESSLHKIPNINDFDQFVYLANKYRNIFRNNFVYNAPLSYEESYSFFSNLNKDNSRVSLSFSVLLKIFSRTLVPICPPINSTTIFNGISTIFLNG